MNEYFDFFGGLPQSSRTSSKPKRNVFISSPPTDNFLNPCIVSNVLSNIPQRGESIQIINELKELQENWDGYESYAISPQACEHALGLIHNIPSDVISPDITPTSNGTISMEWNLKNIDLFLEIGRTSYSLICKRKAGASVFYNGKDNSFPAIFAALSEEKRLSTTATSTLKINHAY